MAKDGCLKRKGPPLPLLTPQWRPSRAFNPLKGLLDVNLTETPPEAERVNEVKDAILFPGGRTALHLAAERGHLDVVLSLLEGEINVDHQDIDGRSALHDACYEGHAAIVLLLVQKGADLDLLDRDNHSPLHDAHNERQHHVIDVLVERGFVAPPPPDPRAFGG